MSESIEHKNTFYFKDRLKQAYVSLDGKQNDRITKCRAETQIKYYCCTPES